MAIYKISCKMLFKYCNNVQLDNCTNIVILYNLQNISILQLTLVFTIHATIAQFI